MILHGNSANPYKHTMTVGRLASCFSTQDCVIWAKSGFFFRFQMKPSRT